MTTLNLNLPQENKKRVVFVNFTNTKRYNGTNLGDTDYKHHFNLNLTFMKILV